MKTDATTRETRLPLVEPNLAAEPEVKAVPAVRKVNVLFMQSQSFFGSDSMIHSLLMRHLDRERFTVHAACNPSDGGKESPSLAALKVIPNLQVRQTNFGPTLNSRTGAQVATSAVRDGLPAMASLAGLVRYARQHRIDIVHGTEKPRDAFYGLLLARLVGAKCVIHLHVKVEGWISAKTRWAMRQADGLLGVSEFVASSAVAMGYSPDRTFAVLNSLDASRWDYNTDGRRIRQEFGVPPSIPLLTIISRLFPWKGHADLLKALALVKDEGLEFRLLVVGEDDPRATPGGGSYTSEMKALAGNLGLGDRVTFTGHRRDIREILAAADVFTMPTFEEPCAVAFLEAMAMKKPVIALDSGGTPQLVDHGKAGLLSAPGDLPGLARHIAALLKAPDLRAQMGEYGRRRVEEYFRPERMALETEQIYRRLLAHR